MTMPPTTDGTPTRMRATHADREHVVGIIERSVADGALTPDEGAERIQAVRASVYRDEFAVFVADLPAAAPPAPVPTAVFASSAPASGRLRGFVARNRVLSWVIAALLVLVVVAGGVAVATEGFGGGHHDRGGSHGQLHDRNDH